MVLTSKKVERPMIMRALKNNPLSGCLECNTILSFPLIILDFELSLSFII